MNECLTNLDSLCAKYGFDIVKESFDNGIKAKDIENQITKSIGVLQENGVYALFLYIRYQKTKPIEEKSLMVLNKAKVIEHNDETFEIILKLAEDLDKLLFARQLLEQTLIYARYHAKAMGEST